MDDLDVLQGIADELGGDLRTDYSGRAMYGKQCVGIVCDDAVACIEGAAREGITGARTDDMGRHSIVYWPHIQAVTP